MNWLRLIFELYALGALATLVLLAWLDERTEMFIGNLRVAEAAIGALGWPASLPLLAIDWLIELRDRRRG